MNQLLTTVPAHFDGHNIQLDVPIALKRNSRLLVVVLGDELEDQVLIQAAMGASESAFASVWDNAEDAVYDKL